MVDLAFDKMFFILGQEDIIFFEDDFKYNDSKSSIVYSVLRQNKSSREEMLNDIKKINPSFATKLYNIISAVDAIDISAKDLLESIEEYNFESAFVTLEDKIEKVKRIYDEQEFSNIPAEVYDLMHFYGIGVEYPNLLKNIFTDYIFREFEWKNFKVFRSFLALDQERLQNYVQKKGSGLLVCIIDNQLGNQSRAYEISNVLKKLISETKCEIIGCILSSTTQDENIDEDIYLENVNKNEFEKLQPAIAKSAYSYILRKLQGTYSEVMGNAFHDAIKNKNIAYYLSNMASHEGITNYQVISEWIRLLFDYKLQNNPVIYQMVRITKLIDLLEDNSITISAEMSKLNSFEAFDFNVNKFYEPIASGDIFSIDDKDEELYILVGQDCDMMNVPGRPVRNGISELVSVDLKEQTNIGNEVKHDQENIRIANFRKDINGPSSTMVIKYTHRQFIDNQILQLCQFADDGRCIISLDNRLLEDKLLIMPEYYPEIYDEAQAYFKAIKTLKAADKEAFEKMLKNRNSPRLVSLSDYELENEILAFPIKRICRLKNPYILFVYKMYLDYRGRHPFNTINMSGIQDVDIEIFDYPDEKLHTKVILSTDRNVNRSDLRKLTWVVDPDDLKPILNKVFKDENCQVKDSGAIYLTMITDPYEDIVELVNGKKIVLKKMKKKVKITLRS